MASTARPKSEDRLPIHDTSKKVHGSCIDIIKSRQSNEIVIACCGAIGSGTSKVVEVLVEKLNYYLYKTRIIKASSLIIEASRADQESLIKLPKIEKTKRLQDLGNSLRKDYGNDIVAQLAIQDIRAEREIYLTEHPEEKNRRFATIIDSLKHPSEVQLLSAVYGDMFYLFGVLCPEDIRLARLQESDSRGRAQDIIDRDKSEDIKHGQKLLDTIVLSDFFVNNQSMNTHILKDPIDRFVRLLLGEPYFTPTKQEFAMFVAQSAAMKSACMSRQVGASIINEDGDIISTGRNDVPKSGGGIYSNDDFLKGSDGRCMYKNPYVCKSDAMKEGIKSSIKNAIETKIGKLKNVSEDLILDLADDISKLPRIKGLVEFSRAIHAEMDAITTAARMGNTSLKNAEMFVTTFPCHHCARHIVASGITKVYYIEPYEKSLTQKLHGDSIEKQKEEVGPQQKKVQLIPFQGVAPRKYLQLFSMTERKKDGRRINYDCKKSGPVCNKPLDTHFKYEVVVIAHLKDSDQEASFSDESHEAS